LERISSATWLARKRQHQVYILGIRFAHLYRRVTYPVLNISLKGMAYGRSLELGVLLVKYDSEKKCVTH